MLQGPPFQPVSISFRSLFNAIRESSEGCTSSDFEAIRAKSILLRVSPIWLSRRLRWNVQTLTKLSEIRMFRSESSDLKDPSRKFRRFRAEGSKRKVPSWKYLAEASKRKVPSSSVPGALPRTGSLACRYLIKSNKRLLNSVKKFRFLLIGPMHRRVIQSTALFQWSWR